MKKGKGYRLQGFEIPEQKMPDGRTIGARTSYRITVPRQMVEMLGLKPGDIFDFRIQAVKPPTIIMRARTKGAGN